VAITAKTASIRRIYAEDGDNNKNNWWAMTRLFPGEASTEAVSAKFACRSSRGAAPWATADKIIPKAIALGSIVFGRMHCCNRENRHLTTLFFECQIFCMHFCGTLIINIRVGRAEFTQIPHWYDSCK
jgi:hypothetical protein